jgi:hypothetical protein
MFCSRCGRPVAPDAAFCNACGAPVVKAPEGNGPGAAPVARVAVPLARPGAITALAVIQFLSAGFLLLLAIFALAAGLFASQDPMAVLVALVFGALAVPQLFCGVGLLRLKPYGRTLQLVFAWIGIIGFPLGTLVCILILVYLYKPGVRTLFSGKQPAEFTAAELSQIATDSSGVAIAVVIVVAVVGGLMMVGIIAAIAIPGLLRARQAGNEASAIGSLVAITKAQATYASTCGQSGYAVTLDDLARGPGGGPGFISPDLGTNGVMKSGYRISVAREESADVTDIAAAGSTCNGSSHGTVSSYFAIAEPIGSAGSRYFATDARGIIFSSRDPISNPIASSPSAVPIQ